MSKRALSAALIVFLFSALVGLQFISVAEANIMPPPPPTVKVYIKSDGSVEPSTTPIQRVGNVYVFTDNLLNHTIEVQRGNIIIDGDGFTLKGRGYNAGIRVSSLSNITIKNVNIQNYAISVWLNQSSNNIITSNTMLTFSNVILDSSSNNQIVGNNITAQDKGYGYGVKVNTDSHNNIIFGNFFTDAGIGVRIQDGDYTTVSENHFERGGASVLTYANYNNISNNSMINGREGIAVTGSGSHNTILGNYIVGKSETALQIYHGSYNTICENIVADNGIAVYLGFQHEFPEREVKDNAFYRNNFVNNTQNFFIGYHQHSNFWDKGGEGNYWSNYNGTDANGDGIGDTPYVIDENNQDNHPLMNPVDISEVPEFSSWVFLMCVLIVGLSITMFYRQRLQKQRIRGELVL